MRNLQEEAEVLFWELWGASLSVLKKAGWIDHTSEIAYCDIARLLGFAPHDDRFFQHTALARGFALCRKVPRWDEILGTVDGSNLFLFPEGWSILSGGELISASLFLSELKKEAENA